MSGGRRTFGFAPLSLFALGGSCTGPVTSTFLFTFVSQSDCDDPPRTYIVAVPPSALLRTNAVPPSVVFACSTQPVSVDLAACSVAGACVAAGAAGGVGCGGACSCARTPTAPANVITAIVEVRYRMRTPCAEFPAIDHP